MTQLTDHRRWLPARLIWRWGALLWIGPLLGLLSGLVLVFGFLMENETYQAGFHAGSLPHGVDLEPFLTDLRSDSTLIEVQRQLDRDGSYFKTPIWWLRQRIKVESLSTMGVGSIEMLLTHHTLSGRERLSRAFEETAREILPRLRAKYVVGWLEQIDARAAEIQLVVKAAEAERELEYRSDIPFIDESEQLENDRESLLLDQPYLGSEISLPGSFGSLPPWWRSPPKWVILVGRCTGYGLMAVFPLVVVLEWMWPLRRAPEAVKTGTR